MDLCLWKILTGENNLHDNLYKGRENYLDLGCNILGRNWLKPLRMQPGADSLIRTSSYCGYCLCCKWQNNILATKDKIVMSEKELIAAKSKWLYESRITLIGHYDKIEKDNSVVKCTIHTILSMKQTINQELFQSWNYLILLSIAISGFSGGGD